MAESSEVNAVHKFMRDRADQARDDSSDEDEATAAALAEAAAARQQRRAQEAGSRHAAAVLVEQAEVAIARGALLVGVSRYTDAIELRPHDVDLLAVSVQQPSALSAPTAPSVRALSDLRLASSASSASSA